MRKSNKNLLANTSGFSLGEIMIVLVIIGGIMGIILPKIQEGNINQKIKTSKLKMSEIENKVNEYNAECGKLPKSLAFVTDDDPACKNWTGNPKAKKQLLDGWNTEFVFESTDTGYNLKSLGADKKEGGSNADKDIYSEGSQATSE